MLSTGISFHKIGKMTFDKIKRFEREGGAPWWARNLWLYGEDGDMQIIQLHSDLGPEALALPGEAPDAQPPCTERSPACEHAWEDLPPDADGAYWRKCVRCRALEEVLPF